VKLYRGGQLRDVARQQRRIFFARIGAHLPRSNDAAAASSNRDWMLNARWQRRRFLFRDDLFSAMMLVARRQLPSVAARGPLARLRHHILRDILRASSQILSTHRARGAWAAQLRPGSKSFGAAALFDILELVVLRFGQFRHISDS
jgi:hypothetical protein